MTNREKRSETIEVRIGYNAKRRFMALCQSLGFTASGVLRAAIGVFVALFGWLQVLKSIARRSILATVCFALVASLTVTSIVLKPFESDQEPPDNLLTFHQIDVDRKGYFDLSDFFVYSGMTSQGRLSETKRAETKATYFATLAEHKDTIASKHTSPEFIEGVISNAEQTTAASLETLFQEIDFDQDGRVTTEEFLISEPDLS
jgi:Ca2+-binding EF-hand superfamily protein